MNSVTTPQVCIDAETLRWLIAGCSALTLLVDLNLIGPGPVDIGSVRKAYETAQHALEQQA